MDGCLVEATGFKCPKVSYHDDKQFVQLMHLSSPDEVETKDLEEAGKILKEGVLDHMLIANTFEKQPEFAKALLFGKTYNFTIIDRIDFNDLNLIADDFHAGKCPLLNVDSRGAKRKAEEDAAPEGNEAEEKDTELEIYDVIQKKNWDAVKEEVQLIATFFNYWANKNEKMIALATDMIVCIIIFQQRVFGTCFSCFACVRHLSMTLYFQLSKPDPSNRANSLRLLDVIQTRIKDMKELLINAHRDYQFDSFHNIILRKRSKDLTVDIQQNAIQVDDLEEKRQKAIAKIEELEKEHAWLQTDEFVKDFGKNKKLRESLDKLNEAKAKKSEIHSALMKSDAMAQMAKVRLAFSRVKQNFECLTSIMMPNCNVHLDPLSEDQFFDGCAVKVSQNGKVIGSPVQMNPTERLFVSVSLQHAILKINEPNIVVFQGMNDYPVSRTCLKSQFIVVAESDKKIRYDVWC